MKETVTISSPGRADFLNTHQDYKGLPVVPAALDLRTYTTARKKRQQNFTIRSLDLERIGEDYIDEFEIKVNNMVYPKFFGNYLRGVVNVLVKKGFASRLKGMDIIIRSRIPIGSGLASSAALEVSFTELLNYVYDLGLSRKEVAEVAFTAENQELGIPCGRLDQYGVAIGGIIKIECRPPYSVETLPFKNLTFAIIDSGIRHSTQDIHPKRQEEINMGLRQLMESKKVPKSIKTRLGYTFSDPIWERISREEMEESLTILDEKSKNRILFTLDMQKSTELALKILRLRNPLNKEISSNIGSDAFRILRETKTGERSFVLLGQIMNVQHRLLRDMYDLSLPTIEKICSASLSAGAYGAKISGAGMGGCIIALVKNEEVGKKVVDNCISAGANRGWVSRVGKGVVVEPEIQRLNV
jgi:galactokinase